MWRVWVAIAMVPALAGCLEPAEDVATVTQAATVCADGPTVPGIDVSKWQGDIDWAAVRGSGVEFAYIRVSDGLSSVDGYFDDNWSGAQAAGVLRGAYQFFRPASDPLEQAELFLDMVGSPAFGDLPPVLDIEVSGGKSADEIVAGAQIWLDHVEAELGVEPLIYTGRHFWNGTMEGHPGLADYGLWIPQWGPECPDVMEPWTDWVFFQSSATGSVPGIAGDVDIDVFNGDREALEALAGADAPPPEPPKTDVPGDSADDVVPDAPEGDLAAPGSVIGGCSASGGGRLSAGFGLMLLLALARRSRAAKRRGAAG